MTLDDEAGGHGLVGQAIDLEPVDRHVLSGLEEHPCNAYGIRLDHTGGLGNAGCGCTEGRYNARYGTWNAPGSTRRH